MPSFKNSEGGKETERQRVPKTHNTGAVVPIIDLMFHSSPKDHIHKEGPREEAPDVFVSS